MVLSSLASLTGPYRFGSMLLRPCYLLDVARVFVHVFARAIVPAI